MRMMGLHVAETRVPMRGGTKFVQATSPSLTARPASVELLLLWPVELLSQGADEGRSLDAAALRASRSSEIPADSFSASSRFELS